MAGYDFSHLNVMVVDDYRFMRNLMQQILMAYGFGEVYPANDGTMAANILDKKAVDLVLLDWNMPEIDGIAFTQGVRSGAYGNDPYLPIVMVSGYTGIDRIKTALDAGVHSYLLKPLTPKSLAAKLTQLIESPPEFVRTDSYFGPYRKTLDSVPTDL